MFEPLVALPSSSSRMLETIVRFRMLALGLLVLGCGGVAPSALEAQEIRVSGGTASAPDSDLIGGTGWGMGIRYFHWEGLGFGLETDRFSKASALILACPPQSADCTFEAVDFVTDLNTLSFIFLLAFAARDDLTLRVGGGRVAGRVTSSNGVGRESGQEVVVPDADRGAGPIAWNRGADGNVVAFEVLYRLPAPGPVPLSAFGTFRRHDLTMEGCGSDVSFLCGKLNHFELQLGLATHLFPRRTR